MTGALPKRKEVVVPVDTHHLLKQQPLLFFRSYIFRISSAISFLFNFFTKHIDKKKEYGMINI